MVWLITLIVASIAALFVASAKHAPTSSEKQYAKKAATWRQHERERQLRSHFPARYSLLQLNKTRAIRPAIWTKSQYERIEHFSKQFEQLTAQDQHAELLLEPYMVELAKFTSPLQQQALLQQLTLCEQAVALIETFQRHETPVVIPPALADVAEIAARYYEKKSARF